MQRSAPFFKHPCPTDHGGRCGRSHYEIGRFVPVLLLTCLTGCSSGSADGEGEQAEDEAVLSYSPVEQPSSPQRERSDEVPHSPSPPDEPTEVSRGELMALDSEDGARADLTTFACDASDGVWSAKGTITNPTDQDLVYFVRIGVIETGGSSSSVAFQNALLDVSAGSTESFSADEIVTTGRDDLTCIPRVVRSEAQS